MEGRKLLTWWRIQAQVGIDPAAFPDRPAPLDLVGWVQGFSALPCLKRADVIGHEGLDAFDALTAGQAPPRAPDVN